MKEIKKIIRAFEQKSKNEKMALATVVRVAGSSYRRMGARMLVSENGTWVGGISGGCLEGDALKRARMAILKEKASVITYDTSIDDDHQIGVGLGCNGIIDVLFSPINSDDPKNPIELFKDILNSPRKTRKFITVSHSEDSTILGKLIDFDAKNSLSTFSAHTNLDFLFQRIDEIEKSKNLLINEQLTLFVEVIPPSLQILLMGHQYDLYPLISLIQEIGWDCTVIAQKEKVRTIKDIQIISPENLKDLEIDQNTAIILMSHSLNTDKANLKTILQFPVQYIGMLGPKVRSERIIRELKEEGQVFTESDQDRIFAPTGLDLGATNPEEIALSIVAEIKAVFSQRSGNSLRERMEPIHERDQPMQFN